MVSKVADLSRYPFIESLPSMIDLLTVTGNKRERSVTIAVENNKELVLQLVFSEAKVPFKGAEIALTTYGKDRKSSLSRIMTTEEFYMEADKWLMYYLNYGSLTVKTMKLQSLIWDTSFRTEAVNKCNLFQVNTNSDIVKLLELNPRNCERVLVRTSILCTRDEIAMPTDEYGGIDKDVTRRNQLVHIEELKKLTASHIKIHTTYVSNEAVMGLLHITENGPLSELKTLTIVMIDRYCIDRLKKVFKKQMKGAISITPATAGSVENAIIFKFYCIETSGKEVECWKIRADEKSGTKSAVVYFYSNK